MDFAPRNGVSVVPAAMLHAAMTFAGSLSHQPRQPSAPFNLEACFTMVQPVKLGEGDNAP